MANDTGTETDGYCWVNKTDDGIVKNYKQSKFRGCFGKHGKKPGRFLDPLGIASSGDSIFITDPMKNSVSLFDVSNILNKPSDDELPSDDITPLREWQFSSVFDTAVHKPSNTILVTDPVNKCIHTVAIDSASLNSSTQFSPTITLPKFDTLCGITVTDDGLVAAVDSESGRVVICDGTGEIKQIFGEEGHLNGQFCLPQFICWDDLNRRFFVADTANARVQVFTCDGKFLFSFGEFGSKNGKCCFKYPSGIAADDHGRVFIVDQGLHNVQIFDRNGLWLHTIGGPGFKEGYFNSPKSLCLLKAGDLFVTDSLNSRIQYFL